MAKYNRSILIPYLQDICTIEMLCSKLEKDINKCQRNINWYASEIKREILPVKQPSKDEYEPEADGIIIVSLISIAMAGIGLLIMVFGRLLLIPCVFYFLAWTVWLNVLDMRKEGREKAEALYNEATQRYEDRVKKNNAILLDRHRYELALQDRKRDLLILQGQLKAARELKSSVYNVTLLYTPQFLLYGTLKFCKADSA